MPFGPGKYDAACTEIRERLHATGIILIVIGGEHGNGFSAQLPGYLVLETPEMLESVARQIREAGP